MTSPFYFRDRVVECNNRSFDHLMTLLLEVAGRAGLEGDERREYDRLKALWDGGVFWPGRGLTVEEDVPDLAAQKLWARMLIDTGQAIFLREVGDHTHSYWQAPLIHRCWAAAELFIDAVREREPKWWPSARSTAEFESVVNKRVLQ